MPVTIALLGFAVTWGVMQAKVVGFERALERKADAAVVEAYQRAIISRLDRLSDQMERHLEQSTIGRRQ